MVRGNNQTKRRESPGCPGVRKVLTSLLRSRETKGTGVPRRDVKWTGRKGRQSSTEGLLLILSLKVGGT